jgi:hypothetical protein
MSTDARSYRPRITLDELQQEGLERTMARMRSSLALRALGNVSVTAESALRLLLFEALDGRQGEMRLLRDLKTDWFATMRGLTDVSLIVPKDPAGLEAYGRKIAADAAPVPRHGWQPAEGQASTWSPGIWQHASGKRMAVRQVDWVDDGVYGKVEWLGVDTRTYETKPLGCDADAMVGWSQVGRLEQGLDAERLSVLADHARGVVPPPVPQVPEPWVRETPGHYHRYWPQGGIAAACFPDGNWCVCNELSAEVEGGIGLVGREPEGCDRDRWVLAHLKQATDCALADRGHGTPSDGWAPEPEVWTAWAETSAGSWRRTKVGSGSAVVTSDGAREANDAVLSERPYAFLTGGPYVAPKWREASSAAEAALYIITLPEEEQRREVERWTTGGMRVPADFHTTTKAPVSVVPEAPAQVEPTAEVIPAPAPAPEPAAAAPATEKPLVPDVWDRPQMWEYYDTDPWDIPENNTALHAYYEEGGWIRCAAQSDDRVFHLYWSPESIRQVLPPFPETDGFGRRMIVQRSPDVGVAHIIPDDWGEEGGMLGDGGTWSPGS